MTFSNLHKLNFTAILILLIIIITPLKIEGQGVFKLVPDNVEESPIWAQKMYSTEVNFHEVLGLREEYWKDRPYEKTMDERNFKHWLMHVEHMVMEDGRIEDAGVWSKEMFEKIGGIEGQTQRKIVSSNFADTWNAIGPMDTYTLGSQGSQAVSWQCNIYCIGSCASNPDIVVAGVEGGDLFKSIDRGLNWEPITKDLGVRTITQVAIAPSDPNYIYFVSGNSVYKSIDGGELWDFMFDLGNGATQIAINPINPNDIFVSAYNGLHHSTNGGVNWEMELSGNVWDIVFHPTDVQILYSLKKNESLNRCEFFRSDDGGENFTLKDNGYYYPSVVSEASDEGGRIGVTPAAPDYAYVALIGKSKSADTGWIGLYRSTDKGEGWANLNGQDGGPYDSELHPSVANGNLSGSGIYQGFYDFDMAVSHNDPDRVWVGVTALSVTPNGGVSWQRIGGYSASTYDIGWIHPDIQALFVVGDDIWLATDGGINYSSDEMVTHDSRKRGIYNTTFWGFGQGWNKDTQVGGRYHNGNTGFHQSYATDIGEGSHLRLGGAESPTGYIDPMTPELAHFSDISDVLLPSTATGATSGFGNLSLYPNQSYSDSRSSELVHDPIYATHMYLGNGSTFWKSTNKGATFEAVFDFDSASVLEIEQARDNRDRFYAVVLLNSDCKLYSSLDGGSSWSLVNGLPSTWGRMEIALNPSNELDIWAIFADNDEVWQSTDGGNSWSDLGGNGSELYGHKLRDIQCLGNEGVVVLTTTGGFNRASGASSWTSWESGMPSLWAPYESFPFYRDGLIRVADKGKGVWEAAMPWEISPLAMPMTESPNVFCATDTVKFDCHSILNHEGALWSWSFSPEPVYISSNFTRNPSVIFGNGGYYSVTLTITDLLGNTSTKTIENMVNVGASENCLASSESGGALYCNGNYGHGSTQDLGVTTNEYTAMAWVYPEGIQGGYTGIVLDETESAGFNFRENNEIGYHWPGGEWWWTSGLVAPAGQWSHVAMVLTPTGITIYVNGESVTHNFTASQVAMNAQFIGSYKNWGGRNMLGRVDEVKIWNRALSEGEVREQRHINLSISDVDADPDLLGYFQFNEDIYYLVNKKPGALNGYFSGGATLVESEAPVGGGACDRFNIIGGGLYPTPNCGGDIEVSGGASTPQGEVVFNRIDIEPFAAGNDYIQNSGYWIINTYGGSGNDAAIDPIIAWNMSSLEEGFEGFASEASEISLLSRPANSSGDWTVVCSGQGEVSAVNSSVVLSNSSCGLSSTGQFALSGVAECPGDVDGDLSVGVADVLLCLASFSCEVDCGEADLDGDGFVNVTDVLFVLSYFGSVCSF
jgi:hypothetical protein